MPEELKGE
jgi:hypothetical protein